MEKAAGWVHGSRMPAVYVHLSGADTEEDILEAEGVKTTIQAREPQKIQICPSCNAKAPFDFRYCQSCGFDFVLKKRAEGTEILREEVKQLRAHVLDLHRTLVKERYRPIGKPATENMTDEEADEIITAEKKTQKILKKHDLVIEK